LPEVFFTLRWPDGLQQRCVSPSRSIEQALVGGARYPVAELLRRSSAALERGSERVRAKYGFGCTAAAAQIEALQDTARAYDADALVEVEYVRRAPAPIAFPPPADLSGHHEVVVIGGGQAGLAVSHCLMARGVEHLVLERDRVARSWREQRWDAFCLVTPNWQCELPGYRYDAGDDDGFMLKDDIIGFVQDYAASFGPPLCEGVAVSALSPSAEGFTIATTHGTISAGQVVLAVGGYHLPAIPRVGASLPAALTQLHSSQYKNPASLPDGAVLVVGSGQSGAQIAEDLHLAGRDVHLCVGSAPRVARFYRGRDCVAWLQDMGHYDMPITEHPEGLAARKEPNHYVTGRGGGRDIDLRAFARDGLQLHGRLLGAEGATLRLGNDLAGNLDAADATAERIKDAIDRYIADAGIDAPVESRYRPVWSPPADLTATLDLAAAGIRSVIWATGFRSDWSWVQVPCFDGSGYPTHHRGVTTAPGLYVVGMPWLHTWGSGRFAGIARDAEYLAAQIAAHADAAAPAARAVA
jgi:putative flavoprotein involved in K+ transport